MSHKTEKPEEAASGLGGGSLTHDHDVGVGQNLPVLVGGLALIHGAVRRLGVLYDDGVVKYLPVVCRGLCNKQRILISIKQTFSYTLIILRLWSFNYIFWP